MAEILFLVHRAPWPPDRGDRIRSWHMLEALAKLAPVHVAALADTEADAAIAREKMAPLCKSLTIEVRNVSRPVALAQAVLRGEPVSNRLFRSAALARHVDALIGQGDVSHIVAFSGQMAQYLPARFDGPVLMDFVDVDSAKFATYAEQDKCQPLSWVHAREARVLGAYEAAVARRVGASLFVSEAEAALFRKQSELGTDKVRAVENGIDTDRFDPSVQLDAVEAGEGPLAVFTGQMDYRPNIDAVRWFANDILPLIRQRHPQARFAIVGRAPNDEVRSLEKMPGVKVTGEVPDVRPWLAAADAVVAPLLLARGVQNKLLEAMAMARPVVASAAAATGIDAVPGEHLLVADNATGIAGAVCALFDDHAAAAKMGQAARMRMIARYGWEARLAPLGELLGLPA
ncbi:glycosyl transferase family 1 [Sphingopyxis sp. H038]|uniref:TIGR03087 family PEP-CTERM/XrtA system glycosyltransferase n=1 Tax=unclassified Sphingopyxis TaxID=2614943 RepID=UPI0007304C6A|nr:MULTISPECIES: TIGR03087 family PEP-CTERM/XrtA system glycosyltransferase [unclassified Sphingopyxis]KTE04626.1 glycosyl transferase family 1 [Sphingopyxis sp. H012]KTE07841.1 glycosyl transferase family 1 [Sphingopyxis sp. H093]KTE13162.1 glycosyl transferase family 1 [Sphingopyxis sp. H053]KTE31000.1 glycosyl transferase family 1 [Sphingopyxis sp. H080]KTE37123.1 glycosyl transferase family 1 [Sphingopyxis sp. H038]